MLLKKPDRQRGFKKERIIRVLLNHTDQDISKYRVAQLGDVSEPWCREYTERLEQKEIIKDTEVLKPEKLYREWQEIHIQPNKLEISLQQPEKILQETELDYALTTYHAENIHQGLLFISTTDFYIDPDQIQDWLDIIENKGLLGGGNTQIRATDKHVFYNKQEINSFTTVSIPQLILDLLEEGGHCEEAALKLIEKYHKGKG